MICEFCYNLQKSRDRQNGRDNLGEWCTECSSWVVAVDLLQNTYFSRASKFSQFWQQDKITK